MPPVLSVAIAHCAKHSFCSKNQTAGLSSRVDIVGISEAAHAAGKDAREFLWERRAKITHGKSLAVLRRHTELIRLSTGPKRQPADFVDLVSFDQTVSQVLPTNGSYPF